MNNKKFILSSYDTYSARVFISISVSLLVILMVFCSILVREAMYAFIIAFILLGIIAWVSYLSLNKNDIRKIFIEGSGLKLLNWKKEEIFVSFKDISAVEIDAHILNSFCGSIKIKTENNIFNINTNMRDSFVCLLKILPANIEKVFLNNSEELYLQEEKHLYKFIRVITGIIFIISLLFFDIKLMLDLFVI